MTDITKVVDLTVSGVKDTPEYKEYRKLLEEIKKQPELFERARELRIKNEAIQTGGADNMMDLVDALTNEYEDVINNRLVVDFMEAEMGLYTLLRELGDLVVSGLELE